MSNIIVGLDSGVVEQPITYGHDVQRGATTTRSFRGTEAQITALEQQFIWAGWSTEVTKGAVWALRATWAKDERQGDGGETPVDQWELFANAVEKDLMASDLAAVTGLSAAKSTFLRDVLDGKIETRGMDCSTTDKTPSEILGDSTAISLYKAIWNGAKSIRVNVPTLRHTKTASRGYEFDAAVTNAGYLFTREKLLRDNVIPNWIANNIPPDPASNPWTRTNGVEVLTAWMKHYPQIQVSAFAKSQIVTEWEYGAWATVLYSAAT